MQAGDQFDCAIKPFLAFLDKHFKTCQADTGASPTWLPHLAAASANPRCLCAEETHFSSVFLFFSKNDTILKSINCFQRFPVPEMKIETAV